MRTRGDRLELLLLRFNIHSFVQGFGEITAHEVEDGISDVERKIKAMLLS